MSDQTRGVPDIAGALPLYAAIRRYTLAVQSRLHGEGDTPPPECDHPGDSIDLQRMVCGKCGMTRQDIILARENGWLVPDIDEVPGDSVLPLLEFWAAIADADSLIALACAMARCGDGERFKETSSRLHKIAMAMRFDMARLRDEADRD